MPTPTGLDDTREDERGKELAEKNSPLDQKGAKPLDPGEQAKLDQMEAGLNHGDSAATPKTGGTSPGPSGASGGDSSNGLGRIAQSGLSFMGRHKRGMAAGGGIGGIIIAIIFGFIALLPLKIESMMKNIFEKRVGQYAERSIEARMNKLVEQYLSKSLQAGAEGDVAADGEFDKLIVAQGSLTKDLYKSWRTNKFATNVEKNQGIRFQRGSKAGTVDVYQDDKLMGNYGSADSRQLVNDAIRNETKWFQFYKRHHLRVWMKNALNIQSWKFFKGTNDEDAANKEVQAALVDAATATYGEEVVKVLDCALDDTCDPSNESHNTSEDQDIRDGITEADQAAAQEVENYNVPGKKNVTSFALEKIFGKVVAEKIAGVMAKVTSTAAILGLIDIMSRIDHFFYTGNADKALVDMHKAELASQFSQWLTISDQIKDGTAPNGKKVTGAEVNAAMEQVGDAANSAGFQQLYLGKTDGNGQKLGTANDGSDQSISHSVNEHATPIKDAYVFIASGGDPSGTGATVSHDILNAWYVSGGKVMDLLNSVLGFVLSFAEHIIPGLGSLMNAIGDFATNFILKFLPAAVTGLESGADLFNNLDAGGSVVGEEFMQNIGGALTSVAETNSINQEIADNQTVQDQKTSLGTKLFSPDYDHSLVNTLALMVPSSPSDAANQTASYMAGIFTNPMQWFGRIFGNIPTPFNNFATAAAPTDLYGLNHYDFTDAQLNEPIDDTDLNTATANAAKRLNKDPSTITPDDVTLEDCPDTGDQANMCKLDLVTIQSGYANYTTTDNGGVNNGGN